MNVSDHYALRVHRTGVIPNSLFNPTYMCTTCLLSLSRYHHVKVGWNIVI